MTQPKESISLADVKQRDGESLRSYLTRFNTIVAAMKTSDEMLVHMEKVFSMNKKTELSRDLTKQKTGNLMEFYYRVDSIFNWKMKCLIDDDGLN